jgi:hypothetical protein
VIAEMSSSAKTELRSRVRDHVFFSPDGDVIYEAFANGVKGRAPA